MSRFYETAAVAAAVTATVSSDARKTLATLATLVAVTSAKLCLWGKQRIQDRARQRRRGSPCAVKTETNSLEKISEERQRVGQSAAACDRRLSPAVARQTEYSPGETSWSDSVSVWYESTLKARSLCGNTESKRIFLLLFLLRPLSAKFRHYWNCHFHFLLSVTGALQSEYSVVVGLRGAKASFCSITLSLCVASKSYRIIPQ